MIGEAIAQYPWLWTLAWQSTACLAAGLAASYLLRRRAVRAHQLLLLSLIAAAVLPTMTQIVKQNQWGLFAAERAVPQPQRPTPPPPMEPAIARPRPAAGPGTPPVMPRSIETVSTHPSIEAVPAPSVAAKFEWTRAILPVWLTTAAILLLRLAVQFLLGRRVVRRSQAIDEPQIAGMIEAARTKLGIATPVAIRAGGHIRSPVIWCWARRPILLIPANSCRDSGLDWMSILCHELAHWRRRDHLSGLFAELLICALPWQLLTWWARRRLVALSEEACDDWVLASGQRSTDYARTLLGLAPQAQPGLIPGVVTNPKGLAGRIHRILKNKCTNPRSGLRWTLAAALVTTCIALGIAFAQTSIREPKATDKIADEEGRYTCSGRVLDAQGKPVDGAKVAFYPMCVSDDFAVPKVKLFDTKTTGSDGAFAFSVMPKEMETFGDGYIIVQKPPLAIGWASWTGTENKQCEIILGEGKELTGVVVDEDGEPVPDARIDIAGMDNPTYKDDSIYVWWPATNCLGVMTDAAGRFSFSNIPVESTCGLLLKKRDHATICTYGSSSPYDPLPNGNSRYQFGPRQDNIRLTLPFGIRVKGTVVEKGSGKPLGGIPVINLDIILLHEPAISAADGSFSFSDLWARHNTFTAIPTTQNGTTWVLEETVHANLINDEYFEDIRMELVKAGVFEVLVKDGSTGKPMEGVVVSADRNDSKLGVSDSGVTDRDGLVRCCVPPGSYGIYAGTDEYTSDSREEISIKAGETLRVDRVVAKRPVMTGIVRGPDGVPMADVELDFFQTPLRPEFDFDWNLGDWVRTDSDGKFATIWSPLALEENAADPNQIVKLTMIAAKMERNLAAEVKIDRQTRTLDIQLEPGVTITGRVLNHKQQPVPGAEVNVFMHGGPGFWNTTTGDDGSFRVGAIPGRFRHTFSVDVIHQGDGWGSVDVNTADAHNNHIDAGTITLERGSVSISGIVVDPNGARVSGAVVHCTGPNQPYKVSVHTNSRGRFVIDGLNAEPASLEAVIAQPIPMLGRVETEGGATNVKIVVSNDFSITSLQLSTASQDPNN